MISFELNPSLDLVNWKRVSKLFVLVNWELREPKEIEKSFRASSVTCFVKDQDEIIGFGRTVDDGKYYALLVDIVIHPNQQSKGIGKSIVNELRNKLEGYEFITLTAAPNKEGFYQKIGWKKQKSAYIFPKDQKQIHEHCE
jgi:N-acetylglutamate synthase-like GNAT family acetyltransferase